MTVLVSLVVILLVAALVGRTVARARPGVRPSRARPRAGLGIELPDVVGGRRAAPPSVHLPDTEAHRSRRRA
ncbi:hypothetical protein [Kineococcus indalonis]|uniref:hypothetical protein n=1 Tax=Kineococcus indalonis TaxID=2696566 RepID=UPI0014127414|nr:hypothetical protein [Kineococcus indalonis]NAZ86553.1 hypothetical protein [Kineococcus indalonis]